MSMCFEFSGLAAQSAAPQVKTEKPAKPAKAKAKAKTAPKRDAPSTPASAKAKKAKK